MKVCLFLWFSRRYERGYSPPARITSKVRKPTILVQKWVQGDTWTAKKSENYCPKRTNSYSDLHSNTYKLLLKLQTVSCQMQSDSKAWWKCAHVSVNCMFAWWCALTWCTVARNECAGETVPKILARFNRIQFSVFWDTSVAHFTCLQSATRNKCQKSSV